MTPQSLSSKIQQPDGLQGWSELCRENQMLDAVHHAAIICSDYERSRRFYAEILGLPIIREVWRADRQSWKCDLQVGATQIELFSFPDPLARPSQSEAQGLRHLAFAVAALEPVIEHLQSHDLVLEPCPCRSLCSPLTRSGGKPQT